MDDYTAPVLNLSRQSLQDYLGEDDWNWCSAHTECIPDVLDAAAETLRESIDEDWISEFLEMAIEKVKSW